jgi:hypothetical protein
MRLRGFRKRMGQPPAGVAWMQNSPAGGEEGLQEGGGLFGEDAGSDFDLMIQFGAGEKLETGAGRAALGIIGAVDESWDASLDDRAGAHGAGLEGDIESGVGKAVVAEDSRGFAQDDDFGMSGGIIVANGAIAGAGEVGIIVNQHGTNGDFASVGGKASLVQSKPHELEIVGHGKVRIARQERVFAC